MGRQSSRIVKLNKDHKDFSKNGTPHYQLWHNGELLWEKLADEEEERDYDFGITVKPRGSGLPANFYIKGNAVIDWGDGKTQNVNYSYLEKVQHTYSSSDYYSVKITGNIEDMSFEDTQGVYSIDTPFPSTMSAKTDFTKMFYTDTYDTYSSRYQGGFVKNLFKNCVNAVNFTMCFHGIKDLILPTRLFWNCKNAETFDNCFQNCTFSEALPSDLFQYTTNARSFRYTFESSEVVLTQKMFKNCVYATDFTSCFANATIMSDATYPSDYSSSIKPLDYLNNLFFGLTNAVTFYRCFYYADMRGGYIGETTTYSTANIGNDFFAGCSSVENFKDCFAYADGIESVDANVFDHSQNAKNFFHTFYDCSSINSNVPTLWNRTNVETFVGCYYGCTNALNYADIPKEWR